MRQFFVRLLDVLWREPWMIWKYYNVNVRSATIGDAFKAKRRKNDNNNENFGGNKYILMVDGKVGHGGMFDRLKGAISVYAVSKVQQKDFRIFFDYPFELQKYLEPNSYDWTIEKNDVVYVYPHSRPLFLYGECYAPNRLFKNRSCEAHFYYGYDSLNVINERYGTDFEWGQLYRELFKPTARLQQYIDHYRQELGSDYIVVHTRFLNLLGDKVETAINPELSQSERESLMSLMHDKISVLAKQNNNMRVMLASDSMTFIEYMKRKTPGIYVVPGTVKHIDTAGETNDAENIKMFLDYYLISNARKVYSFVGTGMWPSAFPEYAAKIGGVEFERIVIEEKR